MRSRERVLDQQDGFVGGLNTVADESQVQPNQVRTATNVRGTEQGGAKKRAGTRRLHTSPLGGGQPVRGGYGWQQTLGSTEVVVCNGTLFSGAAAYAMVWTNHGGTLDANAYPSFASFRDASADVVYVADGGLLNKFDGTTLSEDIASTPSTAFVTVHNRRLFGVSGTDDIVSWSQLDDGDTLGIAASGGGQAVVRTFGDQAIKSLASFRSSLYLFHVSGISRFTGWSQDDINIQAGTQGVTGDVGTIAPRSVVVLENGVLFVSDRGVYICSDEGVAPVSVPVDVEFSNLSASEMQQLHTAHRRSAREVWFFVPGSGIFVLNYRTGAWFGPWTGGFTDSVTLANAMWETSDGDGRPIVLVGGNAGYVKRADVGSLDDVEADGTGGNAYSMSLKLHRMFCGSIASEKAFRWAYLLANTDSSSDCVVSWLTQTGTGSYSLAATVAWGGGTWGSGGTWGGEGVVPFRIPIDGRGGYIDMTITDSGERIPLFSRLEVEAFNMGRRG